MKEIKHEAVFGDQLLFNDVSDKAVIVIKNNNSKYIITENESSDCFHLSLCQPDTYIAMRRIIKTPVWTVADQKDGRLPEVGSIFTYRDETLTCHFIDGDGEIWAHDIDNKIVTPLLRDCQPIETPEERAQRLEDEFIDSIMREHPEISSPISFKAGVRATYRKLSGELQAPTKGE